MPNLLLIKTMFMANPSNTLFLGNNPSNTFAVAIALLLVLSFSKLSLTTFVSIDCGSSGSSTDTNGITWTGDNAYVHFGESDQIPSASGILSTLRKFPDGKENCYSIGVENGEKILTRATFLYGNYDKKSSPPIFDLHFDGNFWTTVQTSSEYHQDYEAIYVTKGNSTNICVTQKLPNHIPFISSLEVRSLKPTLYRDVDRNHAFILLGRYAIGAAKTVRYPDDVYDRIWETMGGAGLISVIKSDALDIDTSTVLDNPPKTVMRSAVTTTNLSQNLVFQIQVPPKKLPLYFNTYFSEVTKEAVGSRSMDIYVDNNRIYGPVFPPFGSVFEVQITKPVSSDTSLSLVPRLFSIFPPMLNALEVYQIQSLLTA